MSDKGPTRGPCWDGHGTPSFAPLAAPERPEIGGTRSAPPPAHLARHAGEPPSGRLPDRGRRRGESLPRRRAHVLLLVVLPHHPHLLLPVVVGPTRRSDDRRLRRRPPLRLSDERRDGGPTARHHDLRRERGVRAQLRVPADRLRGFPPPGRERRGVEHPAVPAAI